MIKQKEIWVTDFIKTEKNKEDFNKINPENFLISMLNEK